MKTNNFLARILIGLFLCLGTIGAALAGPGPHEVYTPIKTVGEAKRIPIGSRIALSCDGGPITVVTVGKDRDYLKGFTCPVSKRLYRVSAGSTAHGSDLFEYKTEDGLTAHLLTLGKL